MIWGRKTSASLHKNSVTSKCKLLVRCQWTSSWSTSLNVTKPACGSCSNGVKQPRNRVITAMTCQMFQGFLINRYIVFSTEILATFLSSKKPGLTSQISLDPLINSNWRIERNKSINLSIYFKYIYIWQTVYCGHLGSGGKEEMLQTLLKQSKFLSKKLKLKFVTTVKM